MDGWVGSPIVADFSELLLAPRRCPWSHECRHRPLANVACTRSSSGEFCSRFSSTSSCMSPPPWPPSHDPPPPPFQRGTVRHAKNMVKPVFSLLSLDHSSTHFVSSPCPRLTEGRKMLAQSKRQSKVMAPLNTPGKMSFSLAAPPTASSTFDFHGSSLALQSSSL